MTDNHIAAENRQGKIFAAEAQGQASGGATVVATAENENVEMPHFAAVTAEKHGSRVSFRESKTELPAWLDDYIFHRLGASYDRNPEEAQYNLDSDEPKVKKYLGTYFPRSYCEAFCIFGNIFGNGCYMNSLKDELVSSNEINILDIGCGTGGEIIGLLDAIRKYLPSTARINVYAFDGNQVSISCLKNIAKAFGERFRADINVTEKIIEIHSDKDFCSIAGEVRNITFNFILCCKMCG